MQNYTVCCKNTCCKQDNSQWKNVMGCKNYIKDMRNRTCVTGPSKGFVQHLKDKLVNLQNESTQLQFVKKPVKKKQKDYYCLMLRKINNLDKKLQNLENLFVSHLSHTPKEVFNANNNEPLYNYMDFYESVRSLVELANSLKEDILYKQSSNNMPHRNVLHINDRMHVLDSELQNLYTYLDQLQNYASEIKDAKHYFIEEDYQNAQYNYSAFRGGTNVDNKKHFGFNGCQNKRIKAQKRNEDNYGIGYPSPHCVECYECDEGSPVDCRCSMCNVHAKIMSMNPPANRRYSPNRFDYCHGGPKANNSDCSCDLCASGRKKKFQSRNNYVRVLESTLSCSCEICISDNEKIYNKNNCNNARMKLIKPVKKGLNEENLLSELQISYHEMGPSIQGKKKKKDRKRVNADVELETVYYQDIGPESRGNASTSVSNTKSEDSKNQGKMVKSKYSKTVSASNNKEMEMKNVVYYELTPDLNIVTKKKNNTQVFYNSDQNRYQQKNKRDKKNKKKVSSSKDEIQRNVTYRVNTGNFNNAEEETSYKFPKKIITNRKNPPVNSEKEHISNFYETNSLQKKNIAELGLNNNDGTKDKHLHIKFHKKKEFKENTITVERNMKRPEYEYNYTNKRSHVQHRQHGGFCHFLNQTNGKENRANKRFSYGYPYHSEISESDSFETVEENESDSDSCTSQYKLYICTDPNCVEKLSSDELIMLMNKTDLKSCGENLYQLNVSESVEDLKSYMCEKCTIKGKTITHKMKNQNNNEKSKIVIKKEIVECFNCKKKGSEESSEKIKSGVSFGSEKNDRLRNTPTRINSGSDEKYPYKYEINSNESEKKKEKNQTSKKDLGSSSSTNIAENDDNEKTNTSEKRDKDIIVAHSKQTFDHLGPLKVLRGNESISSKALELQGYGNMININIDRGAYSWNQQPGIRGSKTNSGNKNKNLELKDSVSNRPLLLDKTNELPSTTSNITDSNFRNRPNKPKTNMFHSDSFKSSSALDITKNSGKEIKEVISAKSEEFAKTSRPNMKESMKNHSNNKIQLPLYTAQVNSGLFDIKDEKILSKKDIAKKEMSLNYVTEKNSGNVISLTKRKNSSYNYGQPLKTRSMPRKKVINRVSSTRLKRNKVKFNKNFRSYLSKVSSANSVVVGQCRTCPDDVNPFRKLNYNQGRRSYKLPKRKQNFYPRMSSLSGIVKPQVKIIEDLNYTNDFKIQLKDCSNSRYKVASISNYISSTVDTESSYSSVNWEKVAKKLKEDTAYYNIIA